LDLPIRRDQLFFHLAFWLELGFAFGDAGSGLSGGYVKAVSGVLHMGGRETRVFETAQRDRGGQGSWQGATNIEGQHALFGLTHFKLKFRLIMDHHGHRSKCVGPLDWDFADRGENRTKTVTNRSFTVGRVEMP
jgi:hypothetical protein